MLDQSRTAVSQDGAHASMFRLGYRADVDIDGDQRPDRLWCFSLATADTAGAPEIRVCSRAYVNQGDWVHLVGVADRQRNELRLYVNGGPGLQHGDGATGVVANAPGAAARPSTGAFAIGRAQADGAAERWQGDLDDVYAVPRVWSDVEIQLAAAVEDE